MRRFRSIVLGATIGSQLSFAWALTWLLGHAFPVWIAALSALATASLAVWLLRGRVALLFDDRPVSATRAWLERLYFVHWAGSLLGLPLALAGAKTSGATDHEIGAGVAGGWLIGAMFAVYAAFVRPRFVRIRDIDVGVAELPAAFDGYRVVQLSDVHVGSSLPVRRAERWSAIATSLEPDLVALTGDYVASGTRFHVEAARVLGEIRARDGVFAVCGNHDDYGRGEPLRTELRARGVRLLENEHVVLRRGEARLVIVGVDDKMSGRADVDAALDGVDPAGPKIVLVHDPSLFPAIERRGSSLVLAGHTHWGQIAFPFLADRVNLAARFYARHAGTYLEGTSILYVHPGLGTTGPPLRLGAPPELTVLRLRSGAPFARVVRTRWALTP